MTPWQLQDWDGAIEALQRAPDIVVACHVNPDGDALGSLLAASLGLRKLGKTTHPTWSDEPLAVPLAYRFLPGSTSVVQPPDVPSTDVWLALDCGAADRLGVLEAKAKGAGTLINVDHHPGNENFGTHNLVVTDVSSTAEIVAALLRDAGVQLDRDIATCLYTGIVTDTGRFQYSNSRPDTLRLAADLLEYGVPAPDIATEVFESAPFGYLKLMGAMLDRAILFEPERFVYSWITQEDLRATGVAMPETDQLIDQLRATRAADVAAIFKEQEDGRYRVSMRSRGPLSVGAVARTRGGGGHELAAGFTADDVARTVEGIRAELATSRSRA